MKPAQAFAVFCLFIGTTAAQAFNVCELKKQPVSVPGVSSQEMASYQKKLDKECKLYQSFTQVRDRIQNTYGTPLEKVTLYQAMRFVRRVDYDRAKYMNTPVPLIYQIDDDNKPVEQRNSVIWDNWMVGIAQLSALEQKVQAGEDFTFDELRDAHRGFFTLSDEVGSYAHRPDPGQMKPPYGGDRYWWLFKTTDEAMAAQKIEDQIHAKYLEMDLTAQVPGAVDAEVIQFPANVKQVDNGYGIYSGDSRANPKHIENLFRFINSMLKQAHSGTHLVWNGHLMTPGEVALFAQKFYVEIHPFSEGNGRTSRLIQELILNIYDMPAVSSGDLMDIDVLTNHEDYYQIAIQKTVDQMQQLLSCTDQYRDLTRRGHDNLASKDQSMLDYDCRILGVAVQKSTPVAAPETSQKPRTRD